LGERLRFSLPVMSKSGARIYPFESKSVLRYHRRLKAKTAQMDTSLFEEAVGRKAQLFSSDDVGEWGPIYPSESKSVLRYQLRSKAKTAQMDTSLYDEAVTTLDAPRHRF
jgi:hypothetical protein